MLGCYGTGKADKFAEICAAVVLAGEISLSSAVLAGDWVTSHDRLGRPVYSVSAAGAARPRAARATRGLHPDTRQRASSLVPRVVVGAGAVPANVAVRIEADTVGASKRIKCWLFSEACGLGTPEEGFGDLGTSVTIPASGFGTGRAPDRCRARPAGAVRPRRGWEANVAERPKRDQSTTPAGLSAVAVLVAPRENEAQLTGLRSWKGAPWSQRSAPRRSPSAATVWSTTSTERATESSSTCTAS